MATTRCRSLHSLLLAAGIACAPQPEAAPATIIITLERAAVRGIVRDNVRQCEVDGVCYLLLEASDGPVRVEYHHGEGARCDNPATARTGPDVKAGDTIHARGSYTHTAAYHLVDVCCPECVLTVSTP